MLVSAELVLDDKVEDGAGGLLPLLQSEDGEAGVGDDEGGLWWRLRLVSHSVGVDHDAGVTLSDVVALVHHHVVLSATVEVGEGVLVRVEADHLLHPLPVRDLVLDAVRYDWRVANIRVGPAQSDGVGCDAVNSDHRRLGRH